jgi:hypothetical protein
VTAEVLNRVGVVLTFLAGFLLAPQLIGLDRIRRVESWAERRAGSFTTARVSVPLICAPHGRLGRSGRSLSRPTTAAGRRT